MGTLTVTLNSLNWNPQPALVNVSRSDYTVRLNASVLRLSFEARRNEVTSATVGLKQWTDPAKDGWYSGENHIHANYGYGEWYNSPRTMLTQSTGEALSISNFMVSNSDTGGQYAHTSPIYVEVVDKPADSREDARYFLKWIDRLALAVRVRDRIPSAELRAHVDAQLDSARDVYRKLAE